jgi:hypothetical protein
MNAEYGVNPPNATVPSTFEDGQQFLIGTITTATMTYDTERFNGVIVALVNFTNGTAFPELSEPNGNIVEFTFGPNDPNIPDGYDLQAVGRIITPALCTVKGHVCFEYDTDCEVCEGITRLELQYSGMGDLGTVTVTGGVQTEVIGATLILTATEAGGYLPGNTTITVDGSSTTIHTSCSRPLDTGNVIGDFTVADVSKVFIPCEDAACTGITRLELIYNGIGDPTAVTVSDGGYATVAGNVITILPTGDELKGNTTVTVGCDVATIHTSCSQPLEPGFVFGEFEVSAVDKVFPDGGGAGLPSSGSVVGATIDLIDGEGNIYSTMSDEYGNYIFFDVATTDLIVSIVVPLGYSPIMPTEADIIAAPGDIAIVDFCFERMGTQDMPRSCGFWKHQVNSALKGKQKGVQVPADLLLTYFEAIHARFDKYFDVFIPVETLEDFSLILAPKNATMFDKARRQFAGLLLNVVSNRLTTWQFISEDEATVSQAITYVSILLADNDPSNDELAKDIAESINLDKKVGAGIIPLDITQIAYYKRRPNAGGGSGAIRSAVNYPNPFNPVTTIKYELTSAQPVRLAIYNVLGQRVKELVGGEIQSGTNTAIWNGTDGFGRKQAAGVYFYRLQAGNHIVTNRIIMVR